MAKRATAKRLPGKPSLRKTADKLWSRIVRDDWCGKCAVCGNPKIEAHHLIPRGNYATRYERKNGIALCFTHHKTDDNIAPHCNAAGWMHWLRENHPQCAHWYRLHKWDKFAGIKTQTYFVEKIEQMRPYLEPAEFAELVGPTLLGHLDNYSA